MECTIVGFKSVKEGKYILLDLLSYDDVLNHVGASVEKVFVNAETISDVESLINTRCAVRYNKENYKPYIYHFYNA